MTEPFNQDTPSRFYETDPRNRDAPHVVDQYVTHRGAIIKPAMKVVVIGDLPLDGPLEVTELVTFDGDFGFTSAILNGGEFELNAENLIPEQEQENKP